MVAKTRDDDQPAGLDKQSKIQKLRLEAKARKMATKMEKEMLEPGSDSDEEFFKAKKADLASSESEGEQMALPSLSKRKLRKINEEGPYAGKNILVFDAQGKAVPKSSLAGS